MFIYINENFSDDKRGFVINRAEIGENFYYEIVFGKPVTKAAAHRALRRLDDRLPIAYGGELKSSYNHRILPTDNFRLLLLCNGFSHICKGSEKALIVDTYGTLCDYLYMPLTAVRTLYILTKRPDIYDRWNEAALRNFGTSAVLFSSARGIHNFQAVLSPFGDLEAEERSLPFLFGKNGWDVTCGPVLVRGEEKSFLLMNAFYNLKMEKSVLGAVPQNFTKDGKTMPTAALKLRLDSVVKNGI